MLSSIAESRASKDKFREYKRTGSQEIRNEIVVENLRLTEYHVNRYRRRGVAADDLRQVASIAVLKAVERFDPDRGVEFSTFASRTIDGEVKRYFRDRTWSVKPPRRLQELHLDIRKSQESLEQRLGRPPTVEELASELGESVDDVIEAMVAGDVHDSDSLDHTDDDDSVPTKGERILSQIDRGFTTAEDRLVVEELLADMPERDREVLYLRFFENMTQPEIAERIGVSQSYLSRILRGALLEMRRRCLSAQPERR